MKERIEDKQEDKKSGQIPDVLFLLMFCLTTLSVAQCVAPNGAMINEP
jgi:hypothetical protein